VIRVRVKMHQGAVPVIDSHGECLRLKAGEADYKAKVRTIRPSSRMLVPPAAEHPPVRSFNLGKNEALRGNIMLGQITPKELCSMSTEDMATQKMKEMKARSRSRLLFDSSSSSRSRVNSEAPETCTGRCS
jgi:hypothetical protein